MSQNATSTWTATPGDILLLSGNSKSRPLNLAYQSLARGSSALYTHVALVISPFRVIHAIPGEGVEIRAWREIRDCYHIHESSVTRLQTLDDSLRDKLLAQAQYYFGQRYSLIALHKPSETFSDQEGIVCSQFVAQVFHDAGIACVSGSVRRCLPSDIHIHTHENPDWLRVPLCDYLFDPPPKNDHDILGGSMELLFEMDGYAAKMVKENFCISRAIQAMEAALESVILAVEAGRLTVGDVLPTHDFSDDVLSPSHWATAWTHHFATPRQPETFMHENGDQPDRVRRMFIRTCDSIGNIASAAFNEMEALAHLFDGWLDRLKHGTAESQSNELSRHLLELNEALLEKAAILDRALGWKENLPNDFALDLPGIFKSGIFKCEEEISTAGRCLRNISDFANAKIAWGTMRTAVLAQSAEVSSVVEQAMNSKKASLADGIYSAG